MRTSCGLDHGEDPSFHRLGKARPSGENLGKIGVGVRAEISGRVTARGGGHHSGHHGVLRST